MSQSKDKEARRAEAQAQREAKERAEAAKAQRGRRLWMLGGLLVLAAAIIVAIVVATGGGDKKVDTAKAPVGVTETATLLTGIPQQGNVLGKPGAPVTLVEYADLKCPICKEYTASAFPEIVRRYVRTGKVKMVFRAQHFVGEQENPGDSLSAAQMAIAAGKQNQQWNFSDLFYANQQDELTRYVTPEFLRFIGSGVPGLDVNTALAQRTSPAVAAALAKDDAAFRAAGFTGTPSFQLGKTGGALQPLNVQSFDAASFSGPIDQLLAS